MKLVGLIGGMSYESTIYYYQIINQTINQSLGGLHSARCLIYSVDFSEIEKYQRTNQWEKSAEVLIEAAVSLERAGADFIGICTNTMHKVVPLIQKKIKLPIIHIASETAYFLQENGIRKVGLLGTKYTMEQDFYKEILIKNGIEVMIPDKVDREIINNVIFDELCRGIIIENSRKEYLRIVNLLAEEGVQGIILGCTEIGLLLQENDTTLPLFDTTKIHAKRLAQLSLA